MEWVETKKGDTWHLFDKDGVSAAYVTLMTFHGVYEACVPATGFECTCRTPEDAMRLIDRHLEDATRE